MKMGSTLSHAGTTSPPPAKLTFASCVGRIKYITLSCDGTLMSVFLMFGEFHLLAQKIPLVAVLMSTSLLRVVVGSPLQGKIVRLYLLSSNCPNVKQNIVHMSL